ncbi:MAG: excinuclease ABC subunit UvrC [Gammaproteobacteria bacterium]|nr:excinuclease ABC subunit UvrC [Gammaproteobacteria bacterium]
MQRPSPSEIPDLPGAYLFRDPHGQVIYVGKAKSLRKRVVNHFSQVGPGASKVDEAESVEWIVTANEVEALMLEYSLIKKHRPRFNIRLRDDKSYPYLAITRSDEWPRARVMRGKRKKGTQYFGPYAHAYAIRSTLDLLLKTFPIRTCSDGLYRRHEAMGRPCLLFHIDKCSGPCIGEVTAGAYEEMVDGLAGFLEGHSDDIVANLQRRMETAAANLEYEQAARHRDRLADVEKALARQEVVTDRPEDFDVIAVEEDDLEASLQVLRVRRGRVVGRLGTIIDRVELVSNADLIGQMLRDLYGEEIPPKLILVQEMPPDQSVRERWLSKRRGSRVALRVPQRGSKRRLMETARANATDAFSRHRLRRHTDHNARARALRSLQDALGLPHAPLRIEAYDISTIQGTNTVGSMVVLEDGLPKRSDYRRFKIRTVEGQDDFASMEEVLRRRFEAYLAERECAVEQRGRFSYPPSLVLIDGGAGQLSRAVRVLEDLALDIPVVGLAKKMEEVFLPGVADPIRIPRDEEALHLLQRVRDEAHRFAISYHRKLRSRSMIDSTLDDVPGVGPTRKKQLLRRFGSLKKMRSADVDTLAKVVPRQVAADLYAALHGQEQR